jgi:hypothetical protein
MEPRDTGERSVWRVRYPPQYEDEGDASDDEEMDIDAIKKEKPPRIKNAKV